MTKNNVCVICGKPCYDFQTKCFRCIEKERINTVKENAIEQGYTSREDYICCPYCGEHYGEDDIHDDCVLTCNNCNKDFNLSVNYDISYSTERLELEK
jgi:predicted  nucleic acid-binding Zn ribbon protein